MFIRNRKKFFAITTPIVCACIVFIIVLITAIIPKQKYDRAMALIDSGDYEPAYKLLNGLSYMDSKTKLLEIEPYYFNALLLKSEVGSTVFFGAYEQDKDTSNGKEAIEWRVLEKEGNNILLISEYALDCQQYNTSYTGVTWENCSLRTWMNDIFLNAAFSAEEQEMILSTTVSADKNPEYSTDPGNATMDKVFLLSIAEAEKYFSSDMDRKCIPTAYAKAQGAYASTKNAKGGKATCGWWLRSPGYDQCFAAYVYTGGSVDYYGESADYGNAIYFPGCSHHRGGECVRPALWITLEP